MFRKAKLDKVIDMDVISQDEYGKKINKYRMRLGNFGWIKKIEQQYELGIITREGK